MKKKPWIRACPNCGSDKLGWVGGGVRAVFDFTGATAMSGLMHCEECGNDVLPIEFKSEKERKEFAESLKDMSREGKSSAPQAAPSPHGVDLARGFTITRSVLVSIVFLFGAFLSLLLGDRCYSITVLLFLISLFSAFLAWRARRAPTFFRRRWQAFIYILQMPQFTSVDASSYLSIAGF